MQSANPHDVSCHAKVSSVFADELRNLSLPSCALALLWEQTQSCHCCAWPSALTLALPPGILGLPRRNSSRLVSLPCELMPSMKSHTSHLLCPGCHPDFFVSHSGQCPPIRGQRTVANLAPRGCLNKPERAAQNQVTMADTQTFFSVLFGGSRDRVLVY